MPATAASSSASQLRTSESSSKSRVTSENIFYKCNMPAQQVMGLLLMAALLASGIALAVKNKDNKKSFKFIAGIIMACYPVAAILVGAFVESRSRY